MAVILLTTSIMSCDCSSVHMEPKMGSCLAMALMLSLASFPSIGLSYTCQWGCQSDLFTRLNAIWVHQHAILVKSTQMKSNH